jgi:hypothetical protein
MIRIGQSTIEVFKTEVTNRVEAERLKNVLLQLYPGCSINFDLDDCDNILRMEGEDLDPIEIERFTEELGYCISGLPD